MYLCEYLDKAGSIFKGFKMCNSQVAAHYFLCHGSRLSRLLPVFVNAC